jgi:hypothetical protein
VIVIEFVKDKSVHVQKHYLFNLVNKENVVYNASKRKTKKYFGLLNNKQK